MNQRKLFSILITLTLILITIPITFAAVDEWIISEVDEDVFWATYKFDDVDMVYLQGDNMRIIGWYMFDGPNVLRYGRHIKEAYLSVRTMGPGLTDLDASMTLYGVPAKRGGALSYLDDLDQVSGPYTTNYVNVNLSSFVGAGVWHNITVTNIVREINQGYYFYDGHNVAFVTLSPDNHDAERYVSSEESGYAAKLYVHYGAPDVGEPDWEFVEEYRNHTIWLIPGEVVSVAYPLEPMEYVFVDPVPDNHEYSNLTSYNSSVTIHGDAETVSAWGMAGRRVITRTSNGTIFVVYDRVPDSDDQVYVKRSIDNGTTWIDETHISDGVGMADYDQNRASIAVDGNDTLHVVWGSAIPSGIYYSKLNNNTTDWSTPLRISLHTLDYPQGYPALAVDSDDNIHVVWSSALAGDPKYYSIYYGKYNGTAWSMPIKLSTYTGMDTLLLALYPAVEVDGLDNIHVSWSSKADGFANSQIWYTTYTDSWSYPLRLSTQNTLISFRPSMATDSLNNVHMLFEGHSTGDPGSWTIFYVNYTDSWGYPLEIANGTGMAGKNQYEVSIAVDSNDYIHAIWSGNSDLFPVFNAVWYLNYTTTWSMPPISIQDIYSRNPHLRWSRFPEFDSSNDTFVVTDENGTLIDTWTDNDDENFTDVDDLKDVVDTDIIGYPDPEDPDPSGWEDPVFWSIHRFKLVLFLIGMILFVGSPIYGFAQRPEAATWIMLMMNMLIGVALLWSLQTM